MSRPKVKGSTFSFCSGDEIANPAAVTFMTDLTPEDYAAMERKRGEKDLSSGAALPRPIKSKMSTYKNAEIVWRTAMFELQVAFSWNQLAQNSVSKNDASDILAGAVCLSLRDELLPMLQAEELRSAQNPGMAQSSLPSERDLRSLVGEVRVSNVSNSSFMKWIGRFALQNEDDGDFAYSRVSKNAQNCFKGNMLLLAESKDKEFVLRPEPCGRIAPSVLSKFPTATLEQLEKVEVAFSRDKFSVNPDNPLVKLIDDDAVATVNVKYKIPAGEKHKGKIQGMLGSRFENYVNDVAAERMKIFGISTPPSKHKQTFFVDALRYKDKFFEIKTDDATKLTFENLLMTDFVFMRAHGPVNPFLAMAPGEDPELEHVLFHVSSSEREKQRAVHMNRTHIISFTLEVDLGEAERVASDSSTDGKDKKKK